MSSSSTANTISRQESSNQQVLTQSTTLSHPANKSALGMVGTNPQKLDDIAEDSTTRVLKSVKEAGINRGGKALKSARYVAAIHNELNKRSETLAAKFLKHFSENLIISRQSNFDAAKPAAHKALNDLVRERLLSSSEPKKITHLAWKLIYKDPAIAAAREAQSASIISFRSYQSNFDPTTVATSAASFISQKSDSIEAPSGFLWKPIAESAPHGLVILLPSAWTGMISGLEVIDPVSGEVIRGKDAGVGNGDREHFRFTMQGADFPSGTVVRVIFKDGSSKEIIIKNTAARTEGR